MIQLILPLLKFPLEAPGRGTWEGRTTHVGCRSHQQNGTYDPVFHSPKTFDQNGDQFDNAVKANNKCSPGKRIWRLAAHRMCWKKQWRRSCFASSATQPSVNLDNHWCLSNECFYSSLVINLSIPLLVKTNVSYIISWAVIQIPLVASDSWLDLVALAD